MVGGGAAADPAAVRTAHEVGRRLAEEGAIVVCGGLGGVMEAVCQGAAEGGGATVGLLPGGDRRAANPHVAVAIATGLGEARNALVVRAGDAVIAIDGEFGTLSEIGLALKLGKPVVGIGTWELGREGQPVEAIRRVDSAEAAVALALSLAAGSDTGAGGA